MDNSLLRDIGLYLYWPWAFPDCAPCSSNICTCIGCGPGGVQLNLIGGCKGQLWMVGSRVQHEELWGLDQVWLQTMVTRCCKVWIGFGLKWGYEELQGLDWV